MPTGMNKGNNLMLPLGCNHVLNIGPYVAMNPKVRAPAPSSWPSFCQVTLHQLCDNKNI